VTAGCRRILKLAGKIGGYVQSVELDGSACL
jgi:hypothetical protein